MTDPRITATLDRAQREFPHDDIVDRLTAVLRKVAALHHEWDGWCPDCGMDWPCPTGRALAPLAELGGDQ